MSDTPLHISQFPIDYRRRMITAYPVIAQMDADEQYYADADDMDAAFNRILASRNLRRTHELFLAEGVVSEGVVTS